MVSGIFMGAGAGATVSIIIRAVDNYSKEFKKVGKAVNTQQSMFGKLGKSLSSIGIGYAALAGAAVGFGVEAVKAGLESERAFQQFNLALGDTADLMLNDLRNASKGLASDFQLVDSANRAMALGIARNQLPQLMEVAAARAKVFGRTVPQAFDDITIGIGRQSRLILDNLGIIINLEEAYKNYADSLGKTTDALSEYDKKQALTNEIIKQTQGLLQVQDYLIETNSEKLQRLSAWWGNTKESAGLFLLSLVETQNAFVVSSEKTEEYASQIYNLSESMRNAQLDIEGIKNSLLGLKSIKLFGETEKDVEIAQKQYEIAQKRLDIARAEQFQDDERFGVEEDRRELERLTGQLELLKLERDANFNSVKNLQAAEGKLFVEQQQNTELTEKEYDNLFTELTTGWADAKIALASYNNELQLTILYLSQLPEAGRTLRQKMQYESGFAFEKGLPMPTNIQNVGDAIIRPNGDVIRTDPKDTIFASKSGGMGGVTVNIDSIYGIDSDDVANSLQRRLNTLIRT